MWVFDGEEWSEEGAVPKSTRPPIQGQPADYYPEMQIVEIPILPTPMEREYPPMPTPGR